MATPIPIPDNPDYKLAYQLDEYELVKVRVAIGPATGLRACFLRVEHGTYAPFAPFYISMQ